MGLSKESEKLNAKAIKDAERQLEHNKKYNNSNSRLIKEQEKHVGFLKGLFGKKG